MRDVFDMLLSLETIAHMRPDAPALRRNSKVQNCVKVDCQTQVHVCNVSQKQTGLDTLFPNSFQSQPYKVRTLLPGCGTSCQLATLSRKQSHQLKNRINSARSAVNTSTSPDGEWRVDPRVDPTS